MKPPSEHVHWLFATGLLVLALCLLAQAIVGDEIWGRRAWRRYLWPSLAFGLGVAMWAVMVFFTNSTLHMLAHGVWAQSMTIAGGAELALASGKLRSRYWRICMPVAFAISGGAFLVHEQNDWLFQRSSFLHHVAGWTLLIGAVFPLAVAVRPRSAAARSGYALVFVALVVILFSDRDLAPVFGHLSPLAGVPHR